MVLKMTGIFGGIFMADRDKTFYDRRVVYLDYLERGEKVKNGGFVKWEARGEDSRVQIQIRGLYPTDTLHGELMLLSAGRQKEADSIGLQYGMGQYVASWNNHNLADTGISLAECDGVLIRLSDKRLLRGQWRESRPQETVQTGNLEAAEREGSIQESNAQESNTQESNAQESNVQESNAQENLPQKCIEQEENPLPGMEEVCEKITEDAAKQDGAEQEGNMQESKIEKQSAQGAPCLQRTEAPVGDKWEQLNRLFPKIRPFGDGREYLSLTPRDFVILERHWHTLVQNSFLLHGYYNYGHVVLVKTENRGEELFYLGVPGVYFEREKQAALMFGFEGFEAADEKATDGGFGYYMKRVEI